MQNPFYWRCQCRKHLDRLFTLLGTKETLIVYGVSSTLGTTTVDRSVGGRGPREGQGWMYFQLRTHQGSPTSFCSLQDSTTQSYRAVVELYLISVKRVPGNNVDDPSCFGHRCRSFKHR